MCEQLKWLAGVLSQQQPNMAALNNNNVGASHQIGMVNLPLG